VQPGDIVEVEVEGLGKLTNRIVHGPTPIRDDCGAQPSESEEVISTAMGGDWEFRGKRAAGGQGAQFYKSKLNDTGAGHDD
jgi:5-oxopent-3-ene-1,2,5-tricarboxylate decarboxylase / 2-hydroxyhepta-2,4-diene-1,7-dioate isomerase